MVRIPLKGCDLNKCFIPSGVEGLDSVLGGGFPSKSLIVLAGCPGVGKTVFSAHFLYHGCVDYGDKGVYVSFAESREAFYENMESFGYNFKRLESEGKFRFLDLFTVKEEGIPAVVEHILKEVSDFGAKRLVIDSFTALAQAFREPHEKRVFLHTVLGKICRLQGCTTLLISEKPCEAENNGVNFSVEDFVADGIIHLKRGYLAHRLIRELEVFKMRGAPILETKLFFTLKNGFRAFSSFKAKTVSSPKRFQPQPDAPGFYSTGSLDMDEMLNGGYPRGAPVLIEIDENISMLQYHLIVVPTALNFITQGRGVIIIPSAGIDYRIVGRRAEEAGLTSNEVNNLLRLCVKDHPGIKLEPYVVAFRGVNILEDYAAYLEVERELMEKTGQPILRVTGVDMLIDNYGARGTISILKVDATKIRETGGLGIMLLKPGYPKLAKILGSVAEVHVKIIREHGKVLVYGVKPRTNLHILEMDTSKGYALPKLTMIM
ncbi:MAG: ATPase domain-containing protein [Candidatus Bathyarchaeia archaeon]